MKGTITADTMERRLSPSVNATVSRLLNRGDVVQIQEAVLGDTFDGDDLWYKLDTGGYVWNGAVDAEQDCAALTAEDKRQFLISYRNIHADGRPDLSSKSVPGNLFFAPLELPAASESIRTNTLIPELFAEGVMQSVRQLQRQRNHVFIYVHGYQLLSSLKLDLLSHFVQNYMTHPRNQIAKVLFMTWPGQGSPARKAVDDRSIQAGQNFTANNLFEAFAVLSKKLAQENKFLNLIVHSFGHQLLNGMVNPAPEHLNKLPGKIFENIFLMAPDISHVTVKKGGAILRNYFKDRDGIDFHYQFSRLKDLASNVHVYHDKYDYLLYTSTKKFVGNNLTDTMSPRERFELTKDYRNLGNFGAHQIAPNELEPGFNFIDIEELIANGEPGKLSDFPFLKIKSSPGRQVDNVWNNADYSGINAGKIIFNLKRFPTHHRYLFTCKPVVDSVMAILKE